jgi:hypothetical protein
VNDWTLTWVFAAQTGFPVSLNAGYSFNCGSYTPPGGTTRGEWINNGNGNPSSCWTVLPQFALQTLPQQISTLRQPTVPNLDLSLQKMFTLTERLKLQFRAEGFNISNTALFAGPDSNPADKLQISGGNPTGFGTIAPSQINFPRILQFSLKLFF